MQEKQRLFRKVSSIYLKTLIIFSTIFPTGPYTHKIHLGMRMAKLIVHFATIALLPVLIGIPDPGMGFVVERLFTPNATIQNSKNGPLQIGTVENGSYALNQSGVAVFQLGDAEWRVDCATLPCTAQSDPITFVANAQNQLVLAATDHKGARISLKRFNRTRDFEIPGQITLTDFDIDQLRMGGSLIFEVDEFIVASVDMTGFGTIEKFMNWMSNGQNMPEKSVQSPLEYMQTTLDAANAPRDILVPYTKPQVQFAIREQNGNPFVP